MMIKLSKFMLLTALLCAAVLLPFASYAQSGGQVIIRDAEIEEVIYGWMAPLMKAAGLSQDSVDLILLQSNEVNAFVAGGSNIFIYTGLIEKSRSPEEVIGVLAHEIGHIAGGHLIGRREALERASYESILGAVLGIGAAIFTGNGAAASAVIAGSQGVAQARFLSHSRVHESSADQAALKYMETAHINPKGLESFFRVLESQELLPAHQQSAYMRTHPLTRDRIDALAVKIKASSYSQQAAPQEWIEQHARMKAKLLGFIDPGRVPWVYSDRDDNIDARYARAIAQYRQNHVSDALAEIDGLIMLEPENPYFQELKGQMLMGFGRVEEAIPYYRRAVNDAPKAGLIRIDLGKALIGAGNQDDGALNEAIDVLERAALEEPRSTRAHRLLATAYGRLGQENVAKLHLAEEAVLERRLPQAKKLAQAAQKGFEQGDRMWLAANDVLNQIKNLEKVSVR
jgi:predicted Zn-dependent protease